MKLPASEADLLRSLSHDLPTLRYRVRSLRALGWTLSAIGAPLGANRSTVRSWELHSLFSSPSPPLPSPPTPDPPLPPPRPFTSHPSAAHSLPAPTPTPAEEAAVRALAPRARRARAGTPPSSGLAQARDELNTLVLDLHRRGVPTAYLAGLAGVTYRAMSVRIRAALDAEATRT